MNPRSIVTVAVLGGVAIGTALGLTTPTAMALHPGDDWRARLPATQIPTLAQPQEVAYNYGVPESVAPDFNIYHGIEAAGRDRYLAFQTEQDARFARLQADAEAQVTRSTRESAAAEVMIQRADAARADADPPYDGQARTQPDSAPQQAAAATAPDTMTAPAPADPTEA